MGNSKDGEVEAKRECAIVEMHIRHLFAAVNGRFRRSVLPAHRQRLNETWVRTLSESNDKSWWVTLIVRHVLDYDGVDSSRYWPASVDDPTFITSGWHQTRQVRFCQVRGCVKGLRERYANAQQRMIRFHDIAAPDTAIRDHVLLKTRGGAQQALTAPIYLTLSI